MTLHQAITDPDGRFKSSAEISASIMAEFKAAEARPRLICKDCGQQTVLDISFGNTDQLCDPCSIRRESWLQQREQKKQFRERQRASGLPDTFHNVRLSDYDPFRFPPIPAAGMGGLRGASESVIRQRQTVHELFQRYCTETEPNHGAMIWGPPGTGKTMLTVALCNRFCYNGYNPKWLDGRELSKLITDDWNFKKANEMFHTRLADEISNYEIVFIEDLQIPGEKPYDWYVTALNDLLNQLIVKRRKVFITTNHRRKQHLVMDGDQPVRDQQQNLWLEKAYGPSFMSRLDALCKPYPLTGPDMRAIL